MITKLVTRRLRNKLTGSDTVSGRIFGVPSFLDFFFKHDNNVALPCAFVADEYDEALPIPSNQGGTYQQVYTYVTVAAAYDPSDCNEVDKDLAYIDFFANFKSKLFSALLGWGFEPRLATVTDIDGYLENVDNHGEKIFEYLGSESSVHKTGKLIYTYQFRVLHIIDNMNPDEVIDPVLLRIANEFQEAGEIIEETELLSEDYTP
jgi:hypothetical protein